MTNPVSGAKLGTLICKALGIDENHVTRVIVDCEATGIARVYVEYADNSPLMDIDWPEVLKGIVPKTNNEPLGKQNDLHTRDPE